VPLIFNRTPTLTTLFAQIVRQLLNLPCSGPIQLIWSCKSIAVAVCIFLQKCQASGGWISILQMNLEWPPIIDLLDVTGRAASFPNGCCWLFAVAERSINQSINQSIESSLSACGSLWPIPIPKLNHKRSPVQKPLKGLAQFSWKQ